MHDNRWRAFNLKNHRSDICFCCAARSIVNNEQTIAGVIDFQVMVVQ